MATIKLRPDNLTPWTEITTLRGAQGIQGVAGQAGAAGADGADGASAYAQAVTGGYNDTEANFLLDLAAIEGLAAGLAAL